MTTQTPVRKIVSLRTINDILPIPNADAIEVAKVGGWNVIVKKGDFKAGDQAIYCEIDSAIPIDNKDFAFLAGRNEKEIDGKIFHILRSMKMRGVISQGLLLPLSVLPADTDPNANLAETLGIKKYEPPVPAELAGQIRGSYPTHFAPKTDAERVQNLGEHIDKINNTEWVATLKIDGTSTTLWNEEDGLHVASRNWELKPDEKLTAVQIAQRENFDEVPPGFIIQAEVFGEGIQKNRTRIQGTDLKVFSVWKDGTSLPREEWPTWALDRAVPILDIQCAETIEGIIDQADNLKVTGLKTVDGSSPQAEGIVFHNATGEALDWLGGRPGFKSINNKWLLKNG